LPYHPVRARPGCNRRLGLTLASTLSVLAAGCGEQNRSPTTSLEPAYEPAASSEVEFRQVTVGEAHTCALTIQGQAFCWGSNDVGALGSGTETGIEVTPVPVAGGRTFRQLTAGSHHTCGVTANDRLFCWGLNHLGQLGDGTDRDRFRPVQIARGIAFHQVSAGSPPYLRRHHRSRRLLLGTQPGRHSWRWQQARQQAAGPCSTPARLPGGERR
jgi:hypothetical protein